MILVSKNMKKAIAGIGCDKYINKKTNVSLVWDFECGPGLFVDGIPYWVVNPEQEIHFCRLIDIAVKQY